MTRAETIGLNETRAVNADAEGARQITRNEWSEAGRGVSRKMVTSGLGTLVETGE